MKILTRYILKETFGPTMLGLLFYTSIILMRQLFDLAGMIIRQSLSLGTVMHLLGLSMPHIIVLTIPMSLLFGILIAVGRLSADSEIIAMRALGISTRTIYLPVFLFSFAIFLLNLYLMNTWLPRANAELSRMKLEIATSGAQKEIRPRVFYDDFENVIVYVNDVDSRTGEWRGVFVADTRTEDNSAKYGTTPAGIAAAASQEHPNAAAGAIGQRSGQRISVAQRGAIVVVKPQQQLWLNLYKASTHVWDPRRPDRYDVNSNDLQRIFLGDKYQNDSKRYVLSLREMDLAQLWTQQKLLARTTDRETYNLVWVEIYKKFSIPFACIAFGVLGLPLGITNRRGGKSSGFSLSIAIILFYYVTINNGEALAAAGKITPFVGMWAANIVLLVIGIYLLIRANRDAGARRREGSIFSRAKNAIVRALTRRGETVTEHDEPQILSRLDITFPNIIDRYVLREFLKILALVVISTAAMIMIIDYTEIANDIRANHIPLHVVLAYYRFLLFQVLNWTLPISVLVSTLVTFGMLSKNNEVTAIKSGGVSLYRVAMPIIAIAVVISVLAYLLLDFVLPYSNQRVDSIHNRIKRGKEAATAAAMQQKLWFAGKGRYLINFLAYDHTTKELTQVQVFELHPTEFRLVRRVYAQSARWNGHAWVFTNGWVRSFLDNGESTYAPIVTPLELYYKETPDDFETELRTPDQMTYAELSRYIDTIRRSGYSAEQLTVKLYTKTSWPVLSLVMALIALPFAFKIGKRGALYGVGIALILGITYWMVFAIFTKFGEVGNLPPLLSAWSANILFSIAAIYMFLNVET
ncbi:MAG TPA: LPS export ABC transporter permease LptG [Thermoanaerobaculia bacterium]|jgi:LPS export ABC transporter permease LptG|nr:LPS export ABC transporter permease LptG [Thermoanaerobaculia bacterium]